MPGALIRFIDHPPAEWATAHPSFYMKEGAMARRRMTVIDIMEIIAAWDTGEGNSAIARRLGYARDRAEVHRRGGRPGPVARRGPP